jgi:hypothetical protein
MIKTNGVRQFAGVAGTALIWVRALALLLGYPCLLCVCPV